MEFKDVLIKELEKVGLFEKAQELKNIKTKERFRPVYRKIDSKKPLLFINTSLYLPYKKWGLNV